MINPESLRDRLEETARTELFATGMALLGWSRQPDLGLRAAAVAAQVADATHELLATLARLEVVDSIIQPVGSRGASAPPARPVLAAVERARPVEVDG